MTSLFEQLSTLLASADWPMEQVPGQPILSVTYESGAEDRWVFVASANDANRTVTVFARLPENCPPERFDAAMRFFSLANFGMTHGAWVMDLGDGEIRFRVGVDVAGRELTGPELSAITNYVNATMGTALAPLHALLGGTMTPEEARQAVYG